MANIIDRDQPVSGKFGVEAKDSCSYSQRRKVLGTLIALTLAAFAFMASANFGIQYAVRALLVQHAHSTGMDWAHHIEARTPTLGALVSSDPGSELKKAPAAVEFTRMINSMLSVGNIYQVDVINPDCYCDISFGTYAAKKSGKVGVEPHSHNHSHANGGYHHPHAKAHLKGVSNATAVPPEGAIRHVFENTSNHQPHSLFGDQQNRFPLDRALTQNIAKNLAHEIYLHRSDTFNQPARFAEVYHPVSADGELSYILRIMVDLEAESARFTSTMYTGFGVFLLLLLGAFAYPAGKYLHTSKRQREADKRAYFLANYDVMTNVRNRNAFHEEVSEVLQSCRAKGQSAAIFLFELDKFKEVNDLHSHQVGDQVICALADKLKKTAPDGCLVARLGGDEFSVVIDGLNSTDVEPTKIMDVPTAIRVGIDDNRQIIEVGISTGIVEFPRDGECLEELMHRVDMALRSAKSVGGAVTVEYDAQMSIDFHERLNLRDDFMRALENSQIVPFYQPLVNMESGQIEGFEALARWDHPTKGILTPFVFGELLSELEFGALVGSTMLKKVVQDMKLWKSNSVAFESIGLNVGEGDLLQPAFALNVVSELVQNGLQPRNLAIEVTETCMFGSNSEVFINQLEHLRTAGCKIALDDFGTGFSSITQIKQLPCTAVKIDKSFVDQVVKDHADQSIIKSLLELGKQLGFKLVLEGVETIDQLDLLRSLGCNIAQGYHYSRPVPGSDVPALVKRLNGGTAKSNKLRVVA